ncbi:hypothetical protein BLNAU_8381 [Blattamonas nauphoetae]|uniref:Uncharacterized protein n=1 Tax=Blattamonas nauphoetae TaxID=2049346 RepID=A0ABQ9XYK4_9EUKA|nr:hypothetical protein BLNAU_8381 [Blattamonas nauphoetae]
MILLGLFIQTSPSHRSTLEFVLASPFVQIFTNCLSFIEHVDALWNTLSDFNSSLNDWNKEGPEVLQSGKRMMQALFSEGFEDTLEQMVVHIKDGEYGFRLVEDCHSISQMLGSNVMEQ